MALPSFVRVPRYGAGVITGELKSKIDRIWDAFWSGGISNPLEVIEQITYLLFIRRLDDLQTLAEKQGRPHRASRSRTRSSCPARPTCAGPASRTSSPAVMHTVVGEQVFPFLRQLGGDGSTYSDHMKDARFTIPTPALLSRVVDMLDDIPMQDRDTNGDLYEYMLSKIATAGTERPVPHAAAHHQAHGRDDRPDTDRRDLRPRLRHGRVPRRRLGVRAPANTRR